MLTPNQAREQLINFKDREFRKFQRESIEYAMNSNKKFTFIKSPVGSGKSLISMCCGVMEGQFNYLVISKYLQNQITRDFPEATSVFGRSNYTCRTNTLRTCEECLASEFNPCEFTCPYKSAKKACVNSRFRILNLQYFMAETQFAGEFSGRSLSVIDEADSIESILLNSVTLSFSDRTLERLGLIGPSRKTPNSQDGLNPWLDFADIANQRALSICTDIKAEIEDITQDEEFLLKKNKEYNHFFHIHEKCEMFLENVDSSWLFSRVEPNGFSSGKIEFKPTWLTPKITEEFLWKHSKRWILMSGTFLPLQVECKRLGIDMDDCEMLEVPSTFPPEKSPVYIWPVANMTYNTLKEETPKLINIIREILDHHKTERGIILAPSFSLCNQIIESIKDKRLIGHTSINKQRVLDDFINSYDPNNPDNKVIISPSMHRGVDLKGGLANFSITVKMPYLSTADKIVSSRLYSGEIGKLWYAADAMSTIEQQCGRSVRSENDYSTCYLLDYQIKKKYEERPSLWSKDFRERISWLDEPEWYTEKHKNK